VKWRCLGLAWLAVALVGCRAAAPPPVPTPVPTVTAVPRPPGAQAQPTAIDLSTADPATVENAFLSNIDDLIAEANDLTATACPDLTQVTRDNPSLVPSLRGFAATMKRVGSSEAVLNTDNVKIALGDLDHTMGALEGALSACKIT
jgi:hypothetical protein